MSSRHSDAGWQKAVKPPSAGSRPDGLSKPSRAEVRQVVRSIMRRQYRLLREQGATRTGAALYAYAYSRPMGWPRRRWR